MHGEDSCARDVRRGIHQGRLSPEVVDEEDEGPGRDRRGGHGI